VVAPPATADVLGTRVSLVDYDDVMDWIDAMVAAAQRGYICVAPVHTIMAAREDPDLRAAVAGASLTVPDGQPIVWALNALGHHLGDRVYGPTLMARYCERSAATGVRMFLYGGRDEDAARRLEHVLVSRYPGLRIAGRYVPPFRPLTEVERDAVAAEINASRADVVWVGIGVPKQEKWMASMRDRLEAPVLVGVGAAFDFHAGLVAQAPRWLQRAGLEWAFRLLQEPRRLWRRYLRYNPRFVAGFASQYARHLLAKRAR
jgi:N-acetylglucosaminyldiphosphoundecaprenol N-acetyl-beta-D-mannosaminyltransferase